MKKQRNNQNLALGSIVLSMKGNKVLAKWERATHTQQANPAVPDIMTYLKIRRCDR